jgi:hypothetical protein
MKKLSNVSPFLLLLFPVFIMMLFAFATNLSNTQEDEVALKTTTPTTTNTIVKATAAILK